MIKLSHILKGGEYESENQWEAAVTLATLTATDIVKKSNTRIITSRRTARKVSALLSIREHLQMNAVRLGIRCNESVFWIEMERSIQNMRAHIS